MALDEIKKQVVLMLQSMLSLDFSARTEAMGFLKNCAINFGLPIPEGKEEGCTNKSSNDFEWRSEITSNSSSQKENLSANNASSELNFDNCDASKSNCVVDCSSMNLPANAPLSTEEEDKDMNVESNLDLPNNNYSLLKNENNENSEGGTEKDKTSICKTKVGVDLLKNEVNKTLTKKTKDNHSGGLRKRKCENRKSVKKKSRENKNSEDETGIFKCPGCLSIFEKKSLLFQHFGTHTKAAMSCRLCRSNFNNMLHFWRHLQKKECKMSLFKCPECEEKFKYRRHYLKHILGHNDNNCKFCDEKFSTWVLYKNHLKEKHPDVKMERDLIPCKFCSMSFRRHLGLYNHYQLEHSKGKFVCLSCGLLLPTKEKYKEHTQIHESEKTWKCKICKMKFYRRQQLLFHVSVHKLGTYKCLTCDITVTSKVDLYKHKKDGHEVKGLEPKFECEICHKNFKKKVVLKNHMATHSVEKQYYCKHCVKSFRTLDALQKHQKRKSHFEKAKIILPESKYEKVYEDKLICENCGKQYKTQRELTWHLRVHKSIYKCDECDKTFTLKVNLTKHTRLHRDKVCVVCELCGNTFNQLSALNEHNLMKHSDVRNAECEVCNKKFKRKSELNRHKRIHEQKRPFACFCGTAFKQSSHLQTHYKTFHEKNTVQTNLVQTENFAANPVSEVYADPVIDRRKPIFVNGEQETLMPLGNIAHEADYRDANSYDEIPVSENLETKAAAYVNNYTLRYPQNELEPINVTYEELNFEASQADKRELVFNSPAVDLSMVTISEVVQNEMNITGHRDISESVESFNKISDDPSNIQLVNLSEHIVQEYLLNLP